MILKVSHFASLEQVSSNSAVLQAPEQKRDKCDVNSSLEGTVLPGKTLQNMVQNRMIIKSSGTGKEY